MASKRKIKKRDKEMTILQKLREIQKRKVLYNICFRKVGVALQFYDRIKIKKEFINLERANKKGVENILSDNWREDLTIEHYYPTLEKAIQAEYNKCIKSK